MSSDVVLAYGYNLGGNEGWRVKEVDKYGDLTVPWYGDGDNDLEGPAEKVLFASIGFAETWETRVDDNYSVRLELAKKLVGVEIKTYYSVKHPMFILATKAIKVYEGFVKQLDLKDMTCCPIAGEWDDKLLTALQVLGLTPEQESPGWLLSSSTSG
jgi:hypothetical protein